MRHPQEIPLNVNIDVLAVVSTYWHDSDASCPCYSLIVLLRRCTTDRNPSCCLLMHGTLFKT